MRFVSSLGVLLVSLLSTTATAQVVGGYTTVLAPAPVAIAPVQSAPVVVAQKPDSVSAWKSVRESAIRTTLRPTSEVVTVNYQTAPQTFTPTTSMQPVPVSLTGGVASAQYYSPTLTSQTVPVQASAPVTVTQLSPVDGANCCVPCACAPITQTTLLPAPAPMAAAVAALPAGHHFSRGIVGQPVVYVERQPIRNFFRFISP